MVFVDTSDLTAFPAKLGAIGATTATNQCRDRGWNPW
jgi:hypothetical protein